MPGTPPARAGLTPEKVIAAAADLTRESYLLAWSIRDLAKRLDVVPSVIYYHVGGKDLLCRQVVELCLAPLEPPDPELDWKSWFRTLLLDLEPLVTEYPGVAHWLIMHGPAFGSVVKVIEGGMAVLDRDGFGEMASSVYTLLLNSPMMTIAAGDDRRQHENDGPRDHARMMADFQAVLDGEPHAQELVHSMVGPFAAGGPTAARKRSTYYRFVVETSLAGSEWALESVRAKGSPRR